MLISGYFNYCPANGERLDFSSCLLIVYFLGTRGVIRSWELICKGISSLLPACCGAVPWQGGGFSRWAAFTGFRVHFSLETWKGYCKVLAASWNDLGRTGPQTAWQEPEALFSSSPALPCGWSCQGIPRMSGFCTLVCFSSICHWIIFIHLWFFHTRILEICLFLDIKSRGSWQKNTAVSLFLLVIGQDIHMDCLSGQHPLARERLCVRTLKSTEEWNGLEILIIFYATLSFCPFTLQ